MDPVELVVRGGTVWTGDPQQPRAGAIAVGGGRILAVGSEADVLALPRSGAAVLDLEGATVLPGLVDSHTHFLTGGFQLSSVDLREADTPKEFVDRIAASARSTEPGRWILGGSWDHERWGGQLPNRDWIDQVTPANPVFVHRLDLHMALANTRALEVARFDPSRPDPPGGLVVRDPADGRPTGVLKDEAMTWVRSAVPSPTPGEWRQALVAAGAHALSLGITQVHDMDGWESLEVYESALAEGSLPLRVYAAVPVADWARLRDRIREVGWGGERLWWGGVKGFVDGSLGSATAWFHEPYDDAPGQTGLTLTDPEQLEAWILSADSAGLQCLVHAIGDRANDWLLDVFGRLSQHNGRRLRRHRVEHAQHLTPEAIPRFSELGVLASVQPYHAADDGRWAVRRVGAGRARTTYAFRSLLDAGAEVAFGSDWTVAPLNPFKGIWAAVTRRTLDGANPGGWQPQEKVSLQAALRAYTCTAARAGFAEGFSGSLTAGKVADFVVLEGDLFSVPETELDSVCVSRTFVQGEEVYRKGSWSGGAEV
jgi:predicted amidohydrolase YtcJ